MSTMLKIQCLVISKPKPEWSVLIQHYLQLLHGRAMITHHYFSPEKFTDISQRQAVITAEAKQLRKYLSADTVVIACSERGRSYTTQKFSEHLLQWSEAEQRTLTFVIGGPLGLDPEFEREAQHLLALSTLTFPHDLAHVVLLEQIYRATTLQSGKTYHY